MTMLNIAESADGNDVASMAEIRPFRKSILRQEEARDHDSERLDGVDASAGATEFCAYNQTAQRFISNQVEVADLSADRLADCLSKLTPNSGMAIWIVPIEELSPTSFRFPVDLLYLSESWSVLEVVHSYPIGRVSSNALAVSILALPAHSVLSSGIETGNQLIVCSPEEMERRILQAYVPTVEIAVKPQLIRNHAVAFEPDQETVVEAIPFFSCDARASGTSEEPLSEDVAPTYAVAADPAPAPSEPEEPETAPDTVPSPPRNRKTEIKKKWWQKLLSDESEEDDRVAPRLALPGLIAYFFTGGAPVAHRVRNISTSGLYVITSERWYKGTVVRITLTDEREPIKERSVTLHGMVVRLTDDGVALQFLLQEENGRHYGTASTLDHLPGGASVKQVEEFIGRFKSG